MFGCHTIRGVGVLIFRPDRSISVNLHNDFIEQMHAASDQHIYALVSEPVRAYLQSSARVDPADAEGSCHYITAVIFAHYLKHFPTRSNLRAVIKAANNG